MVLGKCLLYKYEDQGSSPQHLSKNPGETARVYEPIVGVWTWVDHWNSWASTPQSMVMRKKWINTHEALVIGEIANALQIAF